MTTAIEFLYKYALSKSEYESIPIDQRAFISILGFAITEINTLQKSYIFSDHDVVEKPDIDAAINIQKMVLLRCWSAKLFELSNLLKFKGKYNRTKDPLLLELGMQASQGFDALEGDFGAKLAETIRNETTSHYYLSPARKNLRFINENSNLSFMIHEINGNAFFPIGEELMFYAGFGRFGEEKANLAEASRFLREWMDWNLSASRYASTVFADFMQRIVFERFPEKCAIKVDYWIPPSLVGSKEDGLVPVFFRRFDA